MRLLPAALHAAVQAAATAEILVTKNLQAAELGSIETNRQLTRPDDVVEWSDGGRVQRIGGQCRSYGVRHFFSSPCSSIIWASENRWNLSRALAGALK